MKQALSIYNDLGGSGRRVAGVPQARRVTITALPSPTVPRERPVPAVTRAVAILRVLAGAEQPIGVQAVARELKLVPSTCLHILRALVAEGLVAFDPDTKRYRLDHGLVMLARPLLQRGGFGPLVQPVLESLSRRLGVTAIGLGVRGLDHVLVTAISRAREPFHIHVDLGSRFPALISASGRCIAAFGEHDEADIRERFAGLRWDRAPSFAEWERQVAETRGRGYGIDVDQYILGVTVISAPISVGGRIANALVVVGLTERLRDGTNGIGEELVRLAGEISAQLNE